MIESKYICQNRKLNGEKRRVQTLKKMLDKEVLVFLDEGKPLEGILEFNSDPLLRSEGYYVRDFQVAKNKISRIYKRDRIIFLYDSINEAHK